MSKKYSNFAPVIELERHIEILLLDNDCVIVPGLGGFMAHHNTDIWGDTAPQDICMSATFWVMGGAWLSLHIWEQYLFTQDLSFLREKYPIMRDAAIFIMDYLVPDGEYLVTCPTLSPENTYILPNGEKGVICKGASMDNQIITELLSACISAEKALATGPSDGISERAEQVHAGKESQCLKTFGNW